MTREQKVGVFLLLGMVFAFVAIEMTAGTGLLQRGYHLWAEFDDVHGLNTGDKVRVAGVKMGTVDEIALGKERVRVRMRLDRRAVVRRDSVAKLDYEALSGTRFVSISLGSPTAPVLRDGETISSESVPGITDMVSELQRVGRSIQDLADSLNYNQEQLLSNLNALIEENRRTLAATLANIESITAKFDAGQGALARLLNDPELYDRVASTAANLQAISEQLAQGRGTIGRLLAEDDLYDDLRESAANLSATMRNLNEVSIALRNGEGTIGRLVADDTLYREAEDAIRGLDRATAGIEDQSPIAILGTFVSTLF